MQSKNPGAGPILARLTVVASALLLSLWLTAEPAFMQEGQSGRLSKDQVIAVIKIIRDSKLSEKKKQEKLSDIAAQISNRKVDFVWTPSVKSELEAAGATPEIIEAARLNSLKPPSPTVYPDWSGKQVGPAGKNLRAVYFLDSKRGWIVGDDGYIGYTEDGGKAWGRLTFESLTTVRINDIYFLNEDERFILAGPYIFSNQGAGSKWVRTEPDHVVRAYTGTQSQLYWIKFTSKKKGWVLGIRFSGQDEMNSLLLSTEDGGSSWSTKSFSPEYKFKHFDFADDNHGWLVGEAGKIVRTIDGGKTWQAQNSGVSAMLYRVDFRDLVNGIAVGAKGTILITSDGGEKWRSIAGPVNSDLFNVECVTYGEPLSRECWAVGDKGVIIHTRDDGQTWERQASNTTQPLFGLFISRGAKWIVGGDGMVLSYHPVPTLLPRVLSAPRVPSARNRFGSSVTHHGDRSSALDAPLKISLCEISSLP